MHQRYISIEVTISPIFVLMWIPFKISDRIPNAAIRGFAGFLLCLYAVVFIAPPGLIKHSAHDHLSHHDDTIESDPCHIAIFHPGLDGSCNHKYHFTQGHEDCPLCKIIFLHQYPIEENRCITCDIPQIISFPCASEHDVRDFSILHSARGPPAYLIS